MRTDKLFLGVATGKFISVLGLLLMPVQIGAMIDGPGPGGGRNRFSGDPGIFRAGGRSHIRCDKPLENVGAEVRADWRCLDSNRPDSLRTGYRVRSFDGVALSRRFWRGSRQCGGNGDYCCEFQGARAYRRLCVRTGLPGRAARSTWLHRI